MQTIPVGARVGRSGGEGLYGRPPGWGNAFVQREQANPTALALTGSWGHVLGWCLLGNPRGRPELDTH